MSVFNHASSSLCFVRPFRFAIVRYCSGPLPVSALMLSMYALYVTRSFPVSVERSGSIPPQVATLLQLQGGGRVLRAPGGPVDLDRHPAGGGPRFDEFERTVPAGVGEQPRALADDDREGEEGHLVDKLVVEQPPDQSAAALHL